MKLALLIVVGLAGIFAVGCSSPGAWKPIARTADDIAADLCSQFFSEKMGVSLEDAAKAACATRSDLEPFIDQVLSAKNTAGAMALGRRATHQDPDAGAP